MSNRKLMNAWSCWSKDAPQDKNENHFTLQQYAVFSDDPVLYYRLFNDTYDYDQLFMNTGALANQLSTLGLDPFKDGEV